MATVLERPAARVKPIAADGYERVLAYLSVALLAAVFIALLRGSADWGRVPPLVWAHLATIIVALALTPAILLRRRGDQPHRRLGTIWVVAMFGSAFASLFVHAGPGRFGPIHILSAWVLVQAPMIWWTARARNLRRHRTAVRGAVTGALLIAGFFTFPFNRLLGHWLLG